MSGSGSIWEATAAAIVADSGNFGSGVERREAVLPGLRVEQPVAGALVVADDGRDLRRRRVEAQAAVGLRVAVGQDNAVLASRSGSRHRSGDATMPTAGSGRSWLPAEPSKSGVAVVEDAAVGRDEPVALAVVRRRHADDGRVEREAPVLP